MGYYLLQLMAMYLFEINIIGHTLSDRLELKTNCVCPGHTVTFAECTTVGRYGLTIWTGTSFNCTNNDILLSHTFNATAGECNNGSIVGQGVRISDTQYTSQLIITLRSDLIGKTIQCFHENLDTQNTTEVGTLTIPKPGQFLPSTVLFISKADIVSRQITLSWNKVITSCSNFNSHYNILASNCGRCPSTTNHTTVTCTNVPTDGRMCIYSIQTVTCENILGNLSNMIQVMLKDSNIQHICTGAIVSAALFGGIGACASFIIVIQAITFARMKRAVTTIKQESSERQYEDISFQHSPSGQSTIDTRKNVAYGQVIEK